MAYDTASGTQRWVRLFRNPNASDERLYGAALSTDGSRLVLVGRIDRLATNSLDYGTVSINAGTGAVGWVRYHDRGGNDDAANAVAISRDGTRVYDPRRDLALVEETIEAAVGLDRALPRAR